MAEATRQQPPIVRVTVRVKPKARLTRILRVDGLSLEASLAAPPVDGAANDELLGLLALSLLVPKSRLRLRLGQSSKQKVVEVAGLDSAEVDRRQLLLQPDDN